jgi:hypothetical protein
MMRWIIGVVFSIVGVGLLMTGMNIRTLTDIEGDGAGIHLFGIPINEHAISADLPSYANGFLGTGTIFLILAVCLFFFLLKEKGIQSPLQRTKK